MSQPADIADLEKVPRQPLRCRCHGQMAAWLHGLNGSLAITTYTSGKLVLASSKGEKLHFRTRRFARPMGLAVHGRRMAIAARDQIHLFRRSEEDAVYQLVQSYQTGKLNVHDLAFSRHGIVFANTRFNCIARVSQRKRFARAWQPPFISVMVAQDCCHLNGVGLSQGRVAMATAFCETDERGDWRKHDRFNSGVLIDVPTHSVVARGLCMPHSPRRYRGTWWLCNSGHGSLSQFDPDSGACREVCSLPGFTRGLTFVDHHALVGLSKIRPQHILDAPPVRERHPDLIAGVALVNLTTGRQEGLLEFITGGNEVFEVTFLKGVRQAEVVMPTGPAA